MVRRAGVNKFHATAAQITVHIGNFRHDANVLRSVKGLDEITHHTPLNREDEEWLIQNRMNFSVSALPFFPRLLLALLTKSYILVHIRYHRSTTCFDINRGLTNAFIDIHAADRRTVCRVRPHLILREFFVQPPIVRLQERQHERVGARDSGKFAGLSPPFGETIRRRTLSHR